MLIGPRGASSSGEGGVLREDMGLEFGVHGCMDVGCWPRVGAGAPEEIPCRSYTVSLK